MSTRRGRKSGDSQELDRNPALGKTIQRLRKAYNMSLGELSEHSGVAKSIISQIERNETNPTIGTVYRLSRALDTTIDEVLKHDTEPNFVEFQAKSGVVAVGIATSFSVPNLCGFSAQILSSHGVT